jgi:hypothetical protein
MLPENSVKNGVDAGKNLVDQARYVHSGGKKITLATEVKLTADITQSNAEKLCLAELRNRATAASSKRPYELVSEKTSIANRSGTEVVGCEISVYVWN